MGVLLTFTTEHYRYVGSFEFEFATHFLTKHRLPLNKMDEVEKGERRFEVTRIVLPLERATDKYTDGST